MTSALSFLMVGLVITSHHPQRLLKSASKKMNVAQLEGLKEEMMDEAKVIAGKVKKHIVDRLAHLASRGSSSFAPRWPWVCCGGFLLLLLPPPPMFNLTMPMWGPNPRLRHTLLSGGLLKSLLILSDSGSRMATSSGGDFRPTGECEVSSSLA